MLSITAPMWNANGDALAPLVEFLTERHYDATQRNRILRYAIANRHFAGVVESGELDREDESEAYLTLEGSFPAIPFDDPAWDDFDADAWSPCPAIPPGAALVPPELEPAEFDAAYPFLATAETPMRS